MPAAVLLSVTLGLAFAAPAPAAELEVINNMNAGAGSLREAIVQANNEGDNPGPDTITFAPAVTGMITLTSGELGIGTCITIQGPGAATLAISGNDASRVFLISNALCDQVAISGLTIRDGLATPSVSPASGTGGAISNSGELTLTDVVVTASEARGSAGGAAAGDFGGGGLGGGVFNGGELILNRTTVSANKAQGGDGGGDGVTAGAPGGGAGGGVFNNFGGEPTVTIIDSAITGNVAVGGGPGSGSPALGGGAQGGGVFGFGSPVEIAGSTIAGNTAIGIAATIPGFAYGGGIAASGLLKVTASTISGNVATTGGPDVAALGGGIYTSADGFELANSTVSDNSITGGAATSAGGGIAHSSADGSIRSATIAANGAPTAGNLAEFNASSVENTIVADPQGGGGNCVIDPTGSLDSQGHNLEDADSCGFGQPSDQINTAPLLGALAGNGGPTQTVALPASSPAVDAGAAAGQTEDQRGVIRPQDVITIPNLAGGFDIGAFELEAPPAPPGSRCRGRLPTILGTASADRIAGTPGRDVINARAGRDVVTAAGGKDLVCGGAGGDNLAGGGARDVLSGEAGRDRLRGGPAGDRLLGGAGRDLLRGGPARDVLRGGPGRDRQRQ